MASVVTGAIGGILGSRAAKKAGQQQSDGYNRAGDTVTQAVTDSNAKNDQVAKDVGQQVKDTSATEGDKVVGTAAQGAKSVSDIANTGASDIKSTAKTYGDKVTSNASDYADKALQAGKDAAAGVDPYVQSGAHASSTLDAALAPGGQLNHQATGEEVLKQDPGYNFRLQQGQQALERSQSASGAIGGGGAAKALARYAQGTASSEYGAAFDRYTKTNNDLYDHLSGTADRGLTASKYAGDKVTDATQFGANLTNNADQFSAGLSTDAAKSGASLTTQAGEFNAGQANQAQEVSSGYNVAGSMYDGNSKLHANDLDNANTYNGAVYKGNAEIGASGALANGTLGAANAWQSGLQSIGGGIDGALAGGFGGGGGFSWKGALSGVPQAPKTPTGLGQDF